MKISPPTIDIKQSFFHRFLFHHLMENNRRIDQTQIDYVRRVVYST